MNVVRGRHWGSSAVLRQAHQITRGSESEGEAISFRLTCDATEQAARGGAWKGGSAVANMGWRVDDWLTTTSKYSSFRLVRSDEQ